MSAKGAGGPRALRDRSSSVSWVGSSNPAAQDLQAEFATAPAAASGREMPLILIIDDDRMMCASLELMLDGLYRSKSCSNAAQGVEAINDGVWAVILDIKMPDADGFSVYRQIQKKDPDLPIIFHSAYQNLKDPYEIINEYRPFGYVTKGDDTSKLLKLVALAVTHRQRHNQHRGLLTKLQSIQSQMESLRKRLGE